MNGSGILGEILGFHGIPNPLSDHPFPSFRVVSEGRSLRLHITASLRVKGEPLRLESRRVEGLALAGFQLEQPSAAASARVEGERGKIVAAGCCVPERREDVVVGFSEHGRIR